MDEPIVKDLERVTKNMNETPHHIESRLSRTESAVANLAGQFHELRDSFTASEGRILAKIDSINDKQSDFGKTSWPLVIGVCGLVMTLVIAFVSWGMSQQKVSAVNEAVASVHHNYQQRDNSDFRNWNERIVDRQMDIKSQLNEYYEHREGLELERLVDDMTKRISDAEIATASIATRNGIADSRIDVLEKYSLESIASRNNLDAQVKNIQLELTNIRASLMAATTQLGQLEPLTKDMGLATIKGVSERLEVIEKLVNDIDNKGSRTWNDRPPSR